MDVIEVTKIIPHSDTERLDFLQAGGGAYMLIDGQTERWVATHLLADGVIMAMTMRNAIDAMIEHVKLKRN